jgi:hypothetical protein
MSKDRAGFKEPPQIGDATLHLPARLHAGMSLHEALQRAAR